MVDRPASLIDTRMAKALSHPLRAHLLTILNERVASPRELSDLVEAPLPNVNYHVRALQRLGCVELVRTVPRRGATEHYYRALTRPMFGDLDWERLPRSARQALSDVGLRLIWTDASTALTRGTFERRPDRHLSRTSMTLDDQGWQDVNELLLETYARAELIAADNAQRLSRLHAEGTPTRLVMMHFEMPAEAMQGKT